MVVGERLFYVKMVKNILPSESLGKYFFEFQIWYRAHHLEHRKLQSSSLLVSRTLADGDAASVASDNDDKMLFK